MDEILDERSAAGEPEGYGYETENVALVNLTINPEKKKKNMLYGVLTELVLELE